MALLSQWHKLYECLCCQTKMKSKRLHKYTHYFNIIPMGRQTSSCQAAQTGIQVNFYHEYEHLDPLSQYNRTKLAQTLILNLRNTIDIGKF